MADTIVAPKQASETSFVSPEENRRAMAYARLAFDVARAVSLYQSRRKEQIAGEANQQKEVQSQNNTS